MFCIVLKILYLCVVNVIKDIKRVFKSKGNQKATLTYKFLVMKTQSTNLFNQISHSEVKDLTTMVKETLDFGCCNKQHKTFSAADLWNIQRQRRSFNVRRGF